MTSGGADERDTDRAPVVATTVGEFIDEEVRARGGMSLELSEALGRAFGVSPELFLNLSKGSR